MATQDASDVPQYEYVDVNSKEFNVGKFRSLWLKTLKTEYYSYAETSEEMQDVEFIEEMGVEPQTLEKLKSICSVDSLRSGSADVDSVPPDPQLASLKLRKRRQDYKETLLRDPTDRHEMYANELERTYMGKKPAEDAHLVPEGELILTFNVMYPVIFARFRHVRAFQTLLVLGSQGLCELRDAICCVNDLQVFGEFSSNPDMVPQFISKDHYKSAFFYFNGTFYNDMRFPECQDISKTTQEWARTRDFPSFKTAKMEDTIFNELKLKIGFPYYFTHQGDCEHVVILTDVRLVHQEDCLDRRLYPLIIHKHRVVVRKCSACHHFISRWMTTDDPGAPSDPCLFCDQCFRSFHYDHKGNKLGNFLAYTYVDPGTFN